MKPSLVNLPSGGHILGDLFGGVGICCIDSI